MLLDGQIFDPGTMDSHIGIALKKINSTQNHVGLLYKDSNGVQLCHLAFHHDLRFEKARTDYHWSSARVFDDEEENEQVLAARMITLEKKRGLISYGFFYGNEHSFNAAGEFIEFPCLGMGFTCATFVLELFHSMGFPIANVETWVERDTDTSWKESILEIIKTHDPDHASNAENFKDCVRIRPEEVAACAISSNPPSNFDQAMEIAEQILADLNK